MVGQSEDDISVCKGLRDVAMATEFWQKIGQKSHKMVVTSVVCDTSMQRLVLRWVFSYQRIRLRHSSTEWTKGRYHSNQFLD